MIQTKARGILLDIEGTTSSISFVYDVMFPYVRDNVKTFLTANWDDEGVQSCLPLLAKDLEHSSVASWLDEMTGEEKCTAVCEGVIGLMDADVKATGLKQLQGLVWKDGFHSKQMVAHLFDDVAASVKLWSGSGIDVRIYSSGSIAAQKLFFGHTVDGDLLDCLSGHYDTTTGAKQEADSYTKIAAAYGLSADEILFVSDVVAVLVAADAGGMQTALSLRPGNKPVEDGHGFDSLKSFSEIETTVPAS
jgi:enolase-phosphatase E1